MTFLLQQEIAAGLRDAAPPDLSGTTFDPDGADPALTARRVKWANALRTIVSRRMPRNKIGTPMVSDVDLLLATDEERWEALKKIAKNVDGDRVIW